MQTVSTFRDEQVRGDVEEPSSVELERTLSIGTAKYSTLVNRKTSPMTFQSFTFTYIFPAPSPRPPSPA